MTLKINILRKPGKCPVWEERSVLSVNTKVKDMDIFGEVWATGQDVSIGIRFKKRSDVRGVGVWHLRKGEWAKQQAVFDDEGVVVPDPKIRHIPPTWTKDPDALVKKFIEAVAETTAISEAQALLLVSLYIKSGQEEVQLARQFRMDSNKLWLRAEASRLCAKTSKEKLLIYEDDDMRATILKLLSLRQPAVEV